MTDSGKSLSTASDDYARQSAENHIEDERRNTWQRQEARTDWEGLLERMKRDPRWQTAKERAASLLTPHEPTRLRS